MRRTSRSQEKLTTPGGAECPAQQALRSISGKWKARIMQLATTAPLRFNRLLRELPGSNRQSLTVALRELEADGLLQRTIVRSKPLHVEYALTDGGHKLVVLLRSLEP